MDVGDLAWTIVVGVVMVIGLAGVVVPVAPGLMVMWVAAVVYGFAVGWGTVGVAVVIVSTVLVVVGLITGVVIPQRAAAGSGASRRSQLGALIGAVIGFFVLPVVGVVVGAIAGLVVVEYLRTDDWGSAVASAKATARGFGLAVVVDLVLGLVIAAAWSIWALTVLF